jgi:hypothetical protein
MSKVYLNHPNELLRIDEVYAFVSVDQNGEGIVGHTVQMMGQTVFMPFVCADKSRMESLKPAAKKIAKESGKKIRLIRLSVREEIEEY